MAPRVKYASPTNNRSYEKSDTSICDSQSKWKMR